jgi:para-aminobenzoate synthetase
MDNVTQGPLAAPEEIVSAIERLLSSQGAPIVVALDGGSGAGKSTLAARIADRFDVALIPLDDFFAAEVPDPRWDRFTVEERLACVFDWERLRRDAIEPLLQGRPARWRAFDFVSGLRPDGTYCMLDGVLERAPASVILIEGAYAAGPPLADLVDLSILVDVPVAERHARLRAREDRNFLAGWHQRWDPVERYYFNEVRPKSAFDLVVKG